MEITRFRRTLDTKDYNSINKYIRFIENGLCRKGGDSSTTWMGIEFRWVYKPLKRGGILKRGNSYGCIKYYDTYFYNVHIMEYKEISRENAIKEIMKPYELRKSISDLQDMKECHCCGKIAIGEKDQKAWGKFQYKKGECKTIYLDICDQCSDAIIFKELDELE